MASPWTRLALAALALASAVHARLPDGRAHGNTPRPPAVPPLAADNVAVTDVSGAALPPLNTTYFFDQLIDHTNPSLGTFKQRFWHTWEWYEAGEDVATAFLDMDVYSLRVRSQAGLSCCSHPAKPTQRVCYTCPSTTYHPV